jgi:hypothetical protein
VTISNSVLRYFTSTIYYIAVYSAYYLIRRVAPASAITVSVSVGTISATYPAWDILTFIKNKSTLYLGIAA